MPARDVAAIIVAAGSGNRFGAAKQFEMLGDLPVYLHVARTFSVIEPIRYMVFVTRPDDVDRMKQGLFGLRPPIEWGVVAGGESRQDSVSCGIQAVRELSDISIVLVHDVARALVDDVVVLNVIGAAREFGSAIAGLPIVDTIKRVADSEIVETVPREDLWRAQTPQAARTPLLLTAFDQAKAECYQGTDESQLLERIGEQPRIVLGSELNFKITYPADLERARRIVEHRQNRSV
jgi:2-C-methyl-D-erythritol 4-phosphate cytidylyltransferase